tara:strand:+ start:610 stop:1338 length:729 start_codon:yes stop_codon:yes gene_type:complete
MNESTPDTTREDEDSNLSFSNVISFNDNPNQEQVGQLQHVADISAINNLGNSAHSIDVADIDMSTFMGSVSGLNTATGMVENTLSSSLGNSLNNSLGGPTLSNNDTANISAQYPGNPMTLSELNSVSNENDPYQANMSVMSLGELAVSDDRADTTREESTLDDSSITILGGKKVKKTALDELIKDMNRITYILKGMKVERKVMNKKSKKNKNKNKKKNKRTYKKIKRIPRNNRKRSVKKSKK